MEVDTLRKQVAMLKILLATAQTTLDALQAADNPVDVELVADLERLIERTTGELAALVQRI